MGLIRLLLRLRWPVMGSISISSTGLRTTDVLTLGIVADEEAVRSEGAPKAATREARGRGDDSRRSLVSEKALKSATAGERVLLGRWLVGMVEDGIGRYKGDLGRTEAGRGFSGGPLMWDLVTGPQQAEAGKAA